MIGLKTSPLAAPVVVRRRRARAIARAGPFDFLRNNKDVGGRDTTWEAQKEILKLSKKQQMIPNCNEEA